MAVEGRDDVVTASTGARWREARTRLGSAQKPKAQTPAYLRWVNRRLGGWVAAAAFALRRTPDQVTAASAFLALAGVAVLVLVPPTWASGVAVSALLLAGYAFDSADGQLARLRGGGSPAGEWLDHVVDVAKTCVLHLGLLVAVHRWLPDHPEQPPAVQLLPMAFLTVSVTAFFGTMLRDQLLRHGAGRASTEPVTALRSLLLLPVDHGVLCLLFVLLGAPSVFLAAYAALGLLVLAHTLRVLVRCHRALRA